MHNRSCVVGSAIAVLIATAAHGQAGPAAHVFLGTYKLQPQQDDTTATVTALGKGRYKVAVTWGGMTAGGNYNGDGWEGTGQAKGNVLTIRQQSWDGSVKTCTLTFIAKPKPLYRMKACGGGDGSYRRLPAKR